MKLTVTQKPKGGILGGSKENHFSVQYNNIEYEITIEQCFERKITVSSFKGVTSAKIREIYYPLESLLMLFDGQFYPVSNVFENDVEITECWNKCTLPSRRSADFMLGTGNILLDFSNVLNENIFKSWCSLRKELDLIHKMVLYCISSVEMPKDMNCAFMIEAFLGMCELVNDKHPDFSLPIIPKKPKGSKLKYYFLAVVDRYGMEIFNEELAQNSDEFAEILVNSRNRIAHIKSQQNRKYLEDGECVMYLIKLSLLYRVVIFDLLDIPKDLYKEKLLSRIHGINANANTVKFLKKLSEKDS